MSAVWFRTQVDFGARWRAWVGLALLIGLFSGIVLAAAVPIALLLANVIAAIPARIAAHTRPAIVLRSE